MREGEGRYPRRCIRKLDRAEPDALGGETGEPAATTLRRVPISATDRDDTESQKAAFFRRSARLERNGMPTVSVATGMSAVHLVPAANPAAIPATTIAIDAGICPDSDPALLTITATAASSSAVTATSLSACPASSETSCGRREKQ